ncbi:MAG: OadG family protein [Clostridiales bacterium]|nr:OadG family protein [Clostridiales bacterium]
MDQIGLMERFADPHLFESLNAGEKLAGSLVTTLMGMGATFAILVIIWFAISLVSRILNASQGKTKKKQTDTAVAESVKAQPSAPTVADTVTENQAGTELIAVIMAAIAAKEGSGYTSNLIVRKINRIEGSRPAWNMAGSVDCIESRKIFK